MMHTSKDSDLLDLKGSLMTREDSPPRRRSNAYNFFILVLIIISLVIMVAILLTLDDSTIGLIQFYGNLICVIFLVDFFSNLRLSPRKSNYFIKDRGWLDLLGSLPAPAEEQVPGTVPAPTVEQDITAIKNGLAEMRQLLE